MTQMSQMCGVKICGIFIERPYIAHTSSVTTKQND